MSSGHRELEVLKAERPPFLSRTRNILRYMAVSLIVVVVKLVPGKKLKAMTISFLGSTAGLLLAPVLVNRWRSLSAYGHAMRPGIPSPLFVSGCLIRAGRDHLWHFVVADRQELARLFLSESGGDLLKSAEKNGTGAILIGAHYGPTLHQTVFTMAMGGRRALTMISASTEEMIIPRVNKIRYAVAKRQERLIIKEVKNGGFIVVSDDIPKKEAGGVEVVIGGRQGRLNAFSFKLALRYKIPVFFCSMRDAKGGGYDLVVREAPSFETPEDGVACYAEWLNGLVEENPYMWHGSRFY